MTKNKIAETLKKVKANHKTDPIIRLNNDELLELVGGKKHYGTDTWMGSCCTSSGSGCDGTVVCCHIIY